MEYRAGFNGTRGGGMSECVKLNPEQVKHLTGSARLATEPVYMSERAWKMLVATVNYRSKQAYEKGKEDAMLTKKQDKILEKYMFLLDDLDGDAQKAWSKFNEVQKILPRLSGYKEDLKTIRKLTRKLYNVFTDEYFDAEDRIEDNE